ncbi:MAG: hypothetical protein PVJ15_01915 [Gammaproteobacteria bacterium]
MLLTSGCPGGDDNPSVYYVGGEVTGLLGDGLVLQNNAGIELPINKNGSFRFSTALTKGSRYEITIKALPGKPNQGCTISNGSGVIAGRNISNVVVNCTADYYKVGGNVTGLDSEGLVLQNNGSDDLAILFSGGFSFDTPLVDTSSYAVTIKTQPDNPIKQTCSVTDGSGTLAGADVTDVSVDCITNTYTIGGTVSGLAGRGLVLQNNGGDDLAIPDNGAFSFVTPLDDGGSYSVSVRSQPVEPNQICSVNNDSGLLTGSNVTNVSIVCKNAYAVGGTVSGLSGTGLVLQKNGGDDLTIEDNGGFSFTTLIADNSSYEVTVSTYPDMPVQLCMVANASGTIAGSDVNDVTVSCAAAYSIGGTVIGLAGGGLVLQNNGGDDLAINADGDFRFTTPLANDSAYEATVLTQPVDPNQQCDVNSGSGTVTGDTITDIEIKCVFTNAWLWYGGSDSVNPPGDYGEPGTPAPTNIPPGRKDAGHWTDASGVQWLFGGLSFDPDFDPNADPPVPGEPDYLNDLWTFDGTEWTWVGGSKSLNQPGTYGTQGEAAAANIPGARTGSVSWTDNTGEQWLFGGLGFDTNGDAGYLNDLWKFDGTNWTWIGGSDVANDPGTYGMQGVADPDNLPGGRMGAAAWQDSAGNLWLFGGLRFDPDYDPNLDPPPPYEGYMNDLWKFDGSEWTWVGGTDRPNQAGTYGKEGEAAAANIPGGREGAVSWSDAGDNYWLFGGWGMDAAGDTGYLNDLWKFDVIASTWTWVAGSNLVNQPGIYGTQGTTDTTSIPGARQDATTWTDVAGDQWLLGGAGFDADGNQDYLNDLWKFDGSDWTWVGGSNMKDQPGIYGTRGTADPANIPGGREGSMTWKDAAGKQWIFGGWGLDAGGNEGDLNDLWRYLP